jgi:hypothetical protein
MIFSVALNPNVTLLPGSAQLQQLANGIAGWALVVAVIAMVIGGVLWAIGSHSQNMHQSMAGRKAVVTGLLAGLLVGAAPHLINFVFTTGSAVH